MSKEKNTQWVSCRYEVYAIKLTRRERVMKKVCKSIKELEVFMGKKK